jgi:putative transposase
LTPRGKALELDRYYAEILYTFLAQYKNDYPFLKEVDILALANAQLHLEKAYKNFFQDKSFGFPKFKSKKNPVQSYTTNNQKETVRIIDGKYLKVPKLKSLIRIKLHRQIKGVIKSITLTKKPSGKYFVSILCEEEITEMPKTNACIGIDLGITDFAILSSGDKNDNNRFTAKMEKKLTREQRKLSRRTRLAKEKGIPLLDAKNVQKQKVTVAKLYEKVGNQRTDFLNKLSTDLIKKHDVICIEDLYTKGMMRNPSLARSIADVSWSVFVAKLQYKADWYGKQLVKISCLYPSSQICSTCGHLDGKKALSIRTWTCRMCQTHHDPDVNAAKNILAEGLRLLSTQPQGLRG